MNSWIRPRREIPAFVSVMSLFGQRTRNHPDSLPHMHLASWSQGFLGISVSGLSVLAGKPALSNSPTFNISSSVKSLHLIQPSVSSKSCCCVLLLRKPCPSDYAQSFSQPTKEFRTFCYDHDRLLHRTSSDIFRSADQLVGVQLTRTRYGEC